MPVTVDPSKWFGDGTVSLGGISGVYTGSVSSVSGGVCPIGDSITESLTGGIHHILCIQSNQRRRWGRSFGVSGNTTTQMLARIAAVIATKPSIVPIQGGSNDILAGIPEATTIANIDAMVLALLAAGIRPEIWAIPPRNAYPNETKRINYRLMDLAARRGIPGYDPWTVITNPANGGILAAYDYGDGLHINGAGYTAAANFVLPRLGGLDRTPILPVYDDSIGLLSGGLFQSSAGGVGTGWTVGGTPSIVAGDVGNLQKMDYSLSTGSQSITSPSFTRPNSANRVAIMARIRFTPADAGAALQVWIGSVPLFNGVPQNLHNGAIDGTLYIENTSGNPVSSAATLKFEVTPVTEGVATSGSLEVGQVDVVNLTTLAGIAA